MSNPTKSKTEKTTIGSRIFTVFLENESVIKKFLRRYSSNAHNIEDICQETILRALVAEKNRKIEQPKAFLFGVAKNVARKELEKKSRSLIDFIEDYSGQEYLSDEPGIDEKIDSHKRMLIFWEAVSNLPAQCQKVFVLKKVHGYSHKEIAKHLDISVSTVEKHVASGLKRCNDFMNKRQQTCVTELPRSFELENKNEVKI